jgi:hypothetical protein
VVDGVAYGMVLFYIGQSTPTFPLTDHTPTKHRRNAEIRARYAKGDTIGYLAWLFGISVQRVSQIVLKRRKQNANLPRDRRAVQTRSFLFW